MESAFVTYKITVNGKSWSKDWFPGDEDYIRDNVSRQMNTPPEDVRVEQED